MSAASISVQPLQFLAAAQVELPDASIDLSVRVQSEADGHAWAQALQLTDVCDDGQPHPLNAAVPDFWIGVIRARWSGGQVEIVWHESYTAEHEARWVAAGGPKRHPRVVAPAAEPVPLSESADPARRAAGRLLADGPARLRRQLGTDTERTDADR